MSFMSEKKRTFAKNKRVIPNLIQGETLDTTVYQIRFQSPIIPY